MTCYAITPLTLTQATHTQLAAIIRGHWGIEDRLHWVRDLDWDEDRSQIRTASGPRIMASLRNLVITILRLTGATSIAAALRHHARRPARPSRRSCSANRLCRGPGWKGAVSQRFAEVATLPRVHPRWHQRRLWRDRRRPSCA
jgi:hypothetical protein